MSSPSGSSFAGWPPEQPKTCARCGKRVLQSQSHQVSFIHETGSYVIWHLGTCP